MEEFCSTAGLAALLEGMAQHGRQQVAAEQQVMEEKQQQQQLEEQQEEKHHHHHQQQPQQQQDNPTPPGVQAMCVDSIMTCRLPSMQCSRCACSLYARWHCCSKLCCIVMLSAVVDSC